MAGYQVPNRAQVYMFRDLQPQAGVNLEASLVLSRSGLPLPQRNGEPFFLRISTSHHHVRKVLFRRGRALAGGKWKADAAAPWGRMLGW